MQGKGDQESISFGTRNHWFLPLKHTTAEEEKQEDKERTTQPKSMGSDTWRCIVFLTSGHRVRKAIGEVGAVEHRGISG